MAKKSTGVKLENNTSGKKDEKHLNAASQADMRRAAHHGNRGGTGVNWKRRSANIVYGAGVASPEERLANRVATLTAAPQTTKAASKTTSVSGKQQARRSAPASKPQPAKSVPSHDDLTPTRREHAWHNRHGELVTLASASGNIASLDETSAKAAQWVVTNSHQLPVINPRNLDAWFEAAIQLFAKNHKGPVNKHAVQAAVFSLNKALATVLA